MEYDQGIILNYLRTKKPLIDNQIDQLISNKTYVVSNVNKFGEDGLKRLAEFAKRGKSLRGVLTILGAEMYGHGRNEDNEEIIKLAAIVELIHSSILIQDDIQDDDSMRRGAPTIFKQYQDVAIELNFKNPKFYGQSIAMDVYLMGHYLALAQLGELNVSSEIKGRLLLFLSEEVMKVGVAQSQDIYHAYLHADRVSIEDIENVHLYKTGRYTISMPLMLGGIFAGMDISQMRDIEKASEKLGIIFQVKDDELSIFADEKKLGKKIGIDIMENKKTHYREFLYQRVNNEELKLLKTSFGNKNLSERKIIKIKQLLEKYHIKSDIQEKMEVIAKDAMKIIEEMKIETSCKNILESFITYLLYRTK